jgi:hypothetical protein
VNWFSLIGDRGFESVSLQRRVRNETERLAGTDPRGSAPQRHSRDRDRAAGVDPEPHSCLRQPMVGSASSLIGSLSKLRAALRLDLLGSSRSAARPLAITSSSPSHAELAGASMPAARELPSPGNHSRASSPPRQWRRSYCGRAFEDHGIGQRAQRRGAGGVARTAHAMCRLPSLMRPNE